MNEKFWNVISWLFGLLFLAIGLVNTFWGNDMGFGIFIIVLSLIFFPPLGALIKRMFGFSIHYVIKILIGLFILWAALGVGELFDKISLMLKDFS
ncbi:MAG TPA: hypothetical protein PLH91_13625 [Tenuifilaceae bacterium]|nr:hypothetical protein [Tenuifilaceae bacterium]HPI46269.1 hypothetical protein [Tenuifilaceae bacterium]HPN23055.1 hypothetical protein [Tenuifilaceae bacterium]HPV56755.1 hypothetical protein [Tenuifilaceae bacterium]